MRNVIAIIVMSFLLFSCEEEVQKKSGCTDPNALNRDFDAEVDNGSCTYSDVTFYASAGFFNSIPITKIDITIDGNAIGTIPGTYYPSGPGNCSAQGTVPYQFQNGDKVDWNTTVYLASGATLFGSGQVSPSRFSDCIKVNVTR